MNRPFVQAVFHVRSETGVNCRGTVAKDLPDALTE